MILFILLFLMVPFFLFSQVPEGFSYQAVVRDAGGQIVKEQDVGLRLSILQGSETGTMVYSERHQETTTAQGLVSLVVGEGTVETGDFGAIDWESGPYYLKVEVDLAGGSSYETLGVSALQSVPYALQAGTVGSLTRLEVQGDDAESDSALFVVRRKDGQIVFAVYNEGVRIYVDTTGTAKGPRRGGFAIGGFDMAKGPGQEYLRVTPDSVRIYINDSDAKKPRGGFAIGGYDFGKGITHEYLRVTDDSTRVYVGQSSKGPRGGFAIGGYDFGKGAGATELFNVSTGDAVEVVRSKARFLWYPKKEAFLSGRVLVESPDSVGTNSMAAGFESKSIGDYSQSMGYQCVSRGKYSTAIGYQSLAIGDNSFAVGYKAKAQGTNLPVVDPAFAFGNESFAKSGALSMGNGSFADHSSVAIGMSARSEGQYSVALGYESNSKAYTSVAIGYRATTDADLSTAIGPYCEVKDFMYSTAIGYNAKTRGLWATAIGASGMSGEPKLGPRAYGHYSLALGAAPLAAGEGSVCISSCLSDSATCYGRNAYVLGSNATSSRKGAFVYGDDTKGYASRVSATQDDQFVVRAKGGYLFYADSLLRASNAVVFTRGTGDVGIGTFTPKSNLHVVGDIALGQDLNNRKFILHSRSNALGEFLVITHDNASGGWEWSHGIRLFRNGNVTISSGSDAGYTFFVNGSAAKPGGGSWSNASDIRLKDIRGSYAKGLEGSCNLCLSFLAIKKITPGDCLRKMNMWDSLRRMSKRCSPKRYPPGQTDISILICMRSMSHW